MKRFHSPAAALLVGAMLSACQTTAPPPAPAASAPPPVTTAETACEHLTASGQAALSGLVRLTSPQPVRIGEQTRFRLSANAPAYAQLYMLTASGGPVALSENVYLDGRNDVTYPAPGSGLILTATPPAGTECAIMVLTRQPFAGFISGGAPNRQAVALGMSLDSFVHDLNRRTATLPGQTWTIAKTRFQTSP